MDKNLTLFFVSIFTVSLLLISCHLIGKKEAERTEVSKQHITSVNPEFQFQRIEKGSFTMGSPITEKGRYRNEKQKLVKISKSFEIMTKEVTQKQWFHLMKNNPSHFKRTKDCKDQVIIERVKMCPNHPVERVSWYDVQEYIKKINDSLGLKGCKGTPYDMKGCYRLPTEAEWEYAARGGTKTAYFFGDDPLALGKYAWYWKNSGERTHKVGTKAPNPRGLYDVYGNVWEWVQDGYKGELPGGKNPLVAFGSGRIARGGSWYDFAWYLRSASRFLGDSRYGNNGVGFRLVRTL